MKFWRGCFFEAEIVLLSLQFLRRLIHLRQHLGQIDSQKIRHITRSQLDKFH